LDDAPPPGFDLPQRSLAGSGQQVFDGGGELIFALVARQEPEQVAFGVQQDNRRDSGCPVADREIMGGGLIDVKDVEFDPVLVLCLKPSHGRAYGSADPSPPGVKLDEMRSPVVLDHVQCRLRRRGGLRDACCTLHHWRERRWTDQGNPGRCCSQIRGGRGCAHANHCCAQRRFGGNWLSGDRPGIGAGCRHDQPGPENQADYPRVSHNDVGLSGLLGYGDRGPALEAGFFSPASALAHMAQAEETAQPGTRWSRPQASISRNMA
jgi:hypothetical protein